VTSGAQSHGERQEHQGFVVGAPHGVDEAVGFFDGERAPRLDPAGLGGQVGEAGDVARDEAPTFGFVEGGAEDHLDPVQRRLRQRLLPPAATLGGRDAACGVGQILEECFELEDLELTEPPATQGRAV